MHTKKFISMTNGFTNNPISKNINSITYDNPKFMNKHDFLWIRDKAGYNTKIKNAFNKGAKGIIAPKTLYSKISEINNFPYIYVDKSAISKFCKYHRAQFNIPVIGITGSAGKTTTKNMLSQILRNKGKVLSTIASINAVGSAPFYVLKMNSKHDYGVFEMGMKGLGQIKVMGRYLQPTIGIITNIGDAHIGMLNNSIDNIIKAKQEIISTVSKNGYLILNKDNKYTKKLNLNLFKGKKISYFSINEESDFKATDIQYYKNFTKFNLHYNGKIYNFNLAAIGEHNVYNALAAISAAFILKIPYNMIKNALAKFKNAGMRTQVLNGINNSIIISDAYNANPTAAIEGIKTLSIIAKGNPMVAVIGNMSEQGTHTINAHKKVGKEAADLGVKVVGVGSLGKHVVEGTKLSNNTISAIHIPNKNSAYKFLKRTLQPNMYVYFKASRDFKMETLIRKLTIRKKMSNTK